MSRETAREQLAAAYQAFRSSLVPTPLPQPDLSAAEMQARWACGLWGNTGETLHHGSVRILDFGSWNRGEGPDFLRAEIELNGSRVRGDMVLHPHAEDWETQGCGDRYDFSGVVLHVVLHRPQGAWFTRNADFKEIPVLCLESAPETRFTEPERCPAPLQNASAALLLSLAEAAAAYRLEEKRRRFLLKAETLGAEQAWFEAWAETLGYTANKRTMQVLAHRAPLAELRGSEQTEAILFGTAGFLVPVLPERSSTEARAHHRRLWDAWWPLQESYALSADRTLPWVLSPVRPMNHPQRRVAALAVSAAHWQQVLPLLNIADAPQLRRLLTNLSHPYWDTHCTLPSAPMARPCALVGKQRVDDFLMNHVYAQDAGEASWRTYLAQKSKETPARITRLAAQLAGTNESLPALLHHSYVQQALLQLAEDFVMPFQATDFPTALTEWRR